MSVREAGLVLLLLAAETLPAGELADRFVEAARAAYSTAAYADYTNSLLTTGEFRGWTGRADLPPGRLVRWIDVEGTCNFRDVGGWNGLVSGRVYRGAEPNCHPRDPKAPDRFHDLSATLAGLDTLSKTLGIRTDLDLRAGWESPTPDETPIPGARLVRLPCGSYADLLPETGTVARILRVFADRANYPVYFHCYGGADRTGSVAFILEGLCGASETDLCIDYELTSFSRIGAGRHRMDGPYHYASLVKAMKSRPGTTLTDKIERYVRESCGLKQDEIAAIRRMLVQDENGKR